MMKAQNLVLGFMLFIAFSIPCRKGWGEAYAQQYIPFPTDSAQWSVRNCFYSSQACTSFQHKMKGDTLLNGLVYHKIYYSHDLAYNSPSQTLHCFLREDTTKKVFVKYPVGAGIDTSEFMLYDFNLAIGDTTTIRLLYPTDTLLKLVVTNVDSNLFLNGYRNYIGLQTGTGYVWGGGCDIFSWSVGIGCNIGGLLYNEFPLGACWSDYRPDLVCFWERGTYIFGGTFCDYETGINEIEANNTAMLLYPNPANDEVNIIFNDTTAATALVEIHDLLGKLIERVSLKSGVPFNYNAASLPKSVYMVSLYINGELVENKKLVLIK